LDVRIVTAEARWVRRWRAWASWRLTPDVVVLSAIAVVIDMVTAWTNTELGHLGIVQVSPALPIIIIIATRIGFGALGCSRDERVAWREYLVGATSFLALFAVMFAMRVGTPGDAVGVLVAAVTEEMVYRVAVVIVVGAACARLLGREWRDPVRWGLAPGLVALAAAAACFSALPGHVGQMRGGMTMLPFASLSLLLGYVVLRTGAVWPAIVTHALLNLITLVALSRPDPSPLRLVFAAVTLGSFIVAADVAGRRRGRVNRIPSVIDLEALDGRSAHVS
jgi:membrane protease YdiL (CAAX protease family)